VGRKEKPSDLAKHGIDFHTGLAGFFADPFALTMRDELQSRSGKPLYYAGRHRHRSHPLCGVTVRAQEVIRLISARAATRRERAIYEEAK